MSTNSDTDPWPKSSVSVSRSNSDRTDRSKSNSSLSERSASNSDRSKSASVSRSNSDLKKNGDSAMNGSCPDAVLLAKLEAANRLLEADQKSAHSLSVNGSSHSRKGSISSQTSATSNNSHVSSITFDYDPGGAPEDSWVLWGKIIEDWDNYHKKKTQYLRELVRKGIPHHFRGLVWQLLSSQYNNQEVKDLYAEYLKQNSPYEKVIRRDISRTYPDHDFFREKDGTGQEALFNVMKAYSLHDREVGYCQGSGFIVGLLLMQMPEEEAFAVYVALMYEYNLRDLFKPNMYELGLCMFKLECMLQEYLPELYMHFESIGFYTSIYASSWFLTLYTTSLPLSLACRIMDIFLSEGFEIIYRVGVAILCCNQVELMNADMEGMIKHLQRVVPAKYESDPDSLLQTAFQVKVNVKKLKKLEKEYLAAKTREHEDQIELRRLRSENRLLKQRVENLERETRQLADRIIGDQVNRAQENEIMLSVKRELCAVKQHDASTTQKYQDAMERISEYKTNLPPACKGANCSESSELVQQLQAELMSVRIKEAETHCKLQEMKNMIQTLENENDKLQREPSMTIESLREELIAIKVREAESDLCMREMKKSVGELEQHFQAYVDKNNEKPQSSVSGLLKNRTSDKQLQEEMMSIRLNVAKKTVELRETRQRVMELETQNQINLRQIDRLEKDNDHLKGKVEESLVRESNLHNQIKEHQRKLNEIESDRKEDSMMWRIRDAENSQKTAEMRQKIAELEIENQEFVTAGQLRCDERGENELEARIAELQEELMQHRMNTSMSRMSFSVSRLDGSDSETDSEEELNRTIRDNRMTTSGLMRDLGLNKKGGNLMTMSLDQRFAELSSLVEDVKGAQKDVREEIGDIEINDLVLEGSEDKRMEELFRNLPSAPSRGTDSPSAPSRGTESPVNKDMIDVEVSL